MCALVLALALLHPSPAKGEPPRSVILFIGDGMGPSQLGLLSLYASRAEKSIFKERPLNLERLNEKAQISAILSQPAAALINDSACSATQYASGRDCFPGTLGIDEEGANSESLLEVAKAKGMSVGLVSDTRITHATPAAFAVHHRLRNDESEIAAALLNSSVDVMLSAGLDYFLPRKAKRTKFAAELQSANIRLGSSRSDNQDLLAQAAEKGFELAFTRQGLARLEGPKVLGLFSNSSMPNGIEESRLRESEERSVPTLRDLTREALRLLSSNGQGFFLMVEAGQIDWACHMNDAGTLLHEMIKFDDVLGELLDFVERHPETSLFVTADHETGGFGLSSTSEQMPARVNGKGIFERHPYQSPSNFLSPSLLDKLYEQKQSFFEFFQDFELRPQTPKSLQRALQKNIGLSITTAEAEKILRLAPNPYFIPGHEDLGVERGPDMGERAALYPDIEHNRAPLLAHVLASKSGIVWSTGSHTHTPVFLYSLGSSEELRPFKGFLSSREFGEKLKARVSHEKTR